MAIPSRVRKSSDVFSLRKSLRYVGLGVTGLGAALLAAWALACWFHASGERRAGVEEMWQCPETVPQGAVHGRGTVPQHAEMRDGRETVPQGGGTQEGGTQEGVARDGGKLSILYPLDQTLFPPESVAPTFCWDDRNRASQAWIVTIKFQDSHDGMSFLCNEPRWTPSEEQWAEIKRRSLEKDAEVTVSAFDRASSGPAGPARSIRICTSKDEVGAPIFYREVNLPFIEAVKDPSRIRWRFGEISSSQPPPIVLEKLPVCGNCHSFSADGKVFGMDVDYANDKGSYVVDRVAEEVTLDASNIITWSDYRKEDGELTFGLLSQVSPDGRYVVSTVQDRSVFVPRPNLAFSQLFFPIKGILVVYDRQTRRFQALPGADDKRYVQSNPAWSPDGRYIVFARSRVHQLKNPRNRKTVLLDEEACSEFLKEGKRFLFDLYRIPFNGGKGGQAEPLAGASGNGMSNYFARYSPDGKWIVFCRAKSFMLLQPDSELWIIPAEGGEARRLECNTPRMNSWHSWSPNGRWLVFSSKWLRPYTQLFLTHIDDQGHASPPVLLAQFTAADRAANIPEFVNAPPGALKRIYQKFVDDSSLVRAGLLNAQQGYHDHAVREFGQALAINPNNVEAHVGLGASLKELKRLDEAKAHFLRAIELSPTSSRAYEGLGSVLAEERLFPKALEALREAVRLDPSSSTAHFRMGVVWMDLGNVAEASEHLGEAVRLDPDDPGAACAFALALVSQGKLDRAAAQYERALELDPDRLMALLELAAIRATGADPSVRNGQEALGLATRACQLTRYQDAAALVALAQAQAELGRFADALSAAQQALRIALAQGNEAAAAAIRQQIALFQRGEPVRFRPTR